MSSTPTAERALAVSHRVIESVRFGTALVVAITVFAGVLGFFKLLTQLFLEDSGDTAVWLLLIGPAVTSLWCAVRVLLAFLADTENFWRWCHREER